MTQKWKSLKEKCSRERNKQKSIPSGSAAQPQSMWPLYEAMMAFSSFNQTRPYVQFIMLITIN